MSKPNLYLYANYNWNFWCHVFQLIDLVKSTDLNSLFYWGIPSLGTRPQPIYQTLLFDFSRVWFRD